MRSLIEGLRRCLVLGRSCLIAVSILVSILMSPMITSPAWAAHSAQVLQVLDQHVSRLQVLVDQEDWLDVQSYLGGPMGLVRKDLRSLIQELPTEQRAEATTLSRRITEKMVELGQSARFSQKTEVRSAQRDLASALATFEDFIATH